MPISNSSDYSRLQDTSFLYHLKDLEMTSTFTTDNAFLLVNNGKLQAELALLLGNHNSATLCKSTQPSYRDILILQYEPVISNNS